MTPTMRITHTLSLMMLLTCATSGTAQNEPQLSGDALDVLNAALEWSATLPGVADRNGRPFVVVTETDAVGFSLSGTEPAERLTRIPSRWVPLRGRSAQGAPPLRFMECDTGPVDFVLCGAAPPWVVAQFSSPTIERDRAIIGVSILEAEAGPRGRTVSGNHWIVDLERREGRWAVTSARIAGVSG